MSSSIYECQECHELYCLCCEGGNTALCSDCMITNTKAHHGECGCDECVPAEAEVSQ